MTLTLTLNSFRIVIYKCNPAAPQRKEDKRDRSECIGWRDRSVHRGRFGQNSDRAIGGNV